jgi:hypothetical protein
LLINENIAEEACKIINCDEMEKVNISFKYLILEFKNKFEFWQPSNKEIL